MADPVFSINASLGSSLVISFIFLDYVRKYNTDPFQRSLFLTVLCGSLIAVLCEWASRILTGMPGTRAANALYAVISLFFLAQNCAYYCFSVFIDYFIHTDPRRTKGLLAVTAAFLALYFLSVLGNGVWHYYFSITGDGVYTPGPLYPLRLGVSCFPLFCTALMILRAAKRFTASQLYLLLFFSVLISGGAALDIVFRLSNALWPCFTAALLYLYFFILQADSRIDSLTGIGNRYSFNEFISNLAKQGAKQSYAIVLIDLDRFKEINDALGHLEGDNALRDMALIIKSCIRSTDFAARYGGDEFILAAKAETNMEIIMERIEEALKSQNERGGRPYTLQISYGLDIFTTHGGQSIEDFLAHIDRLMYQHKARRRALVESGPEGIE
ncbi:MAG: diguanylate cyclase [Treponema sp.]|jgi:diguanylate cyclase (GGDEF)-like protein|nr:diguanylate cyclase [Treponema sp.]